MILCFPQQIIKNKLSYRQQIARQQRTRSNSSKYSGKFLQGGSILWDAVGGGRCQKHKFQGGIYAR